MNPILQWIVARVTAQRLLRQCPVCRHRQFAPHARRLEAVRCVRCGADIPPNDAYG